MTIDKKLIKAKDFDDLLLAGIGEEVDWQKICVFDNADPSIVLGEVLDQSTPHIIQNTHPYFAPELNTSAFMLENEGSFAAHPLTTILCPNQDPASTEPTLEIYKKQFCRAGQKSGIMNDLDQALARMQISNSIRGDVLVIADELLTNAIFNAPFVDFENTLPGAPRSDHEVKMHDGKSATITLGADNQRIVVGCRDEYGSLNFEKFLTRVKNCYDAGVAATMRMNSVGGAGIGSFMIFNSSASFYAEIKRGVYTMIFCTLPLKMSSRARLAMPKHIHFSFKSK